MNGASLNPLAKQLRARMTDAERAVWRHLRASRFAHCKFRRQQPVGRFILDYVSFAAKVVIEVDGGQHNENLADRNRDAWSESQGFRVRRFWNNDVLANIDGVLARIAECVAPSPQPLSHQGRGAQRVRESSSADAAQIVPPDHPSPLVGEGPRERGKLGHGVPGPGAASDFLTPAKAHE